MAIALMILAIVLFTLSEKFDVASQQAVVSINASSIYQSFATNENKANEQYKGKVIEVSGILHSVKKDGSGRYQIHLMTESQTGRVLCTLNDRSPKSLNKLEIGKSITVKGFCKGFSSDVKMERGIIMNH